MTDFDKLEPIYQKCVMEDLDLSAVVADLCEWGRSDPDLKDLPLWDELPSIDFSADYAAMDEWVAKALEKFSKKKRLDLIEIRLGEEPEALGIVGQALVKGQPGVDAFLKKHRKHSGWSDDVDWDQEEDLIYKQVKALPGKFWKDVYKWVYDDDMDKYNRVEAAYGIWGTVSRHAIAKALRGGKIDLAATLGDRTKVPILIGSGDEEGYMGILTPQAWIPDTD